MSLHKTNKPNKYKGYCHSCGKEVAEKDGTIAKISYSYREKNSKRKMHFTDDGQWVVLCKDCVA